MPPRFASLFCALVFASATTGLAQSSAEDLLSRGQALLEDGKGKKALAVFEEALESAEAKERQCSVCLLAMAAAQTQMRHPTLAERSARRVVESTDNPVFTVPAYNYIGLSFFHRSIRDVPRPWDERALYDTRNQKFLGNMKEAEAAFRKALEFSEDDPERLRWNLATALEWQSREDEALPLFYSSADPDEWDSWEGEDIDIDIDIDDPLRMSSEIQLPKLILETELEYSSLARAARIEGLVVLRSILEKDGRVRQVRALDGLPGLTAEAIRAVRQWRWEPARLNGEPVDVYFDLTVDFSL